MTDPYDASNSNRFSCLKIKRNVNMFYGSLTLFLNNSTLIILNEESWKCYTNRSGNLAWSMVCHIFNINRRSSRLLVDVNSTVVFSFWISKKKIPRSSLNKLTTFYF